MEVKSLSHVQLCATPWTVAHQAPPSMGFSRQEYWSRVPLRSPHCSLTRLDKFKSLITYSFGETKLKYTLSWIVGDKTRWYFTVGHIWQYLAKLHNVFVVV